MSGDGGGVNDGPLAISEILLNKIFRLELKMMKFYTIIKANVNLSSKYSLFFL